MIAEVVGGEHDIEKAENKAGVKAGEWTWEIMRDAFLEHQKETAAYKSFRNNISVLGTDPNGALHKDFEPLAGVPAKSITPNDLAAVTRNNIQRGKLKSDATRTTNYPQARLTHAAIQAVFSWATHPDCLTLNIARLVRAPKRPKLKARDLRPEDIVQAPLATPKQIYTFVFHWCYHDKLTKDCSRAALMLQALTGKRIATGHSRPSSSECTASHGSMYGRYARTRWARSARCRCQRSHRQSSTISSRGRGKTIGFSFRNSGEGRASQT